jgi:predicted Zn-dependent protease
MRRRPHHNPHAMKSPGLLPLLLVLAGSPFSLAQEPADPPVSAEEAQAKALRYYDALVKRPTGGYLFDRFYNAWLDTQTLDELEKYLTQRAEAADAATGHRLVLAFFHMRQNASAKALELFAKALEKDPGNAEAWFQKALAESRAGNVDKALADLEKSLAAKPNKETGREARQLQGRLLVRAGKNADAAKVWEALLAENPDDEDLHEDLVEIQLTEGQTEDALKTVLALLEKTRDPYKRIQRRLRAGDIESKLGNRDNAIAAYAECLADVGSDSWLEREILSQIEQVYRKDDAVAELREKYDKLIEAHPQRVALRRGLAKVQAELGEGEAALRTWQELLPLAPGDRALREAYVQMLADNKRIGEAVAQLEALIKLEANDPELLMQLAEFHWRADKKDDCLKSLRTYLSKADATTETAALRVAAQMERYDLKDAALALYAETAKKFAASETALLAHAAALHRADKKEEARVAWRALAKDADGPRLSAIARGVAAREEHALAEELLAARLKDFIGDSTFLQFYCETAIRADKPEAAALPARALLNLAKDTVSLDTALANAVRVLDRAKLTAETLKEFQAAASPTMQEKCLLAEMLDKSGEAKKAEAVLREVAAADAVIGHAALVRVQSARGEFKSAAESQEALVNAPGGRKAVHIQRLVELYEKAGLTEKALSWTVEWRKAAPGSVLVWIKESDLLAASGKPADALRVMRQAAQQFPADEEIRLRLGEAFRTEGKFADAARIYTMMFEDAKDTANKVRYAGELAKTAEMSGSMSALLEQFEERRKGNRGSILPLLALAEIHRAAGNYEGRRQALLEANRVKQGDPELLMEIARIEESEGKYESALETLQEVKKLDKSGKADERIMRVLFVSGRDQEALQMFFRNAGGEKMDPRAAEEMALDLTQMGLWEEAESILQKLTPLHPGDYRLGYLHVTTLIELEKSEEAAAGLLRLLEIKNELVLPKTADPAQQQQQQSGSYYHDEFGSYYRPDSKLMSMLPPGMGEMLSFRGLLSNAKNFQQNRRNNYYGGSRGAAIPNSLERLRDAVLIQCLLLTAEFTAEQKSALWKEIASRTALPRELLGPDGVPLENPDEKELEKRATAADASPALFALYTYASGPRDPAMAARAWDTFKDTFPLLAWRSLGRLITEKDEAALRPIVEATERVKNWKGTPSAMEFQFLLGMGSGRIPDEVSPLVLEHGRALGDRAVEWRKTLMAGSDEEKQIAHRVAQFRAMFLERTDVKAWVAFLEEEMERKLPDPENNPKRYFVLPRGLVWPALGAYGLSGTCWLLNPRSTDGITPVYYMTGPNSRSGSGGSSHESLDEDRARRLQEALTVAKHPAVRIALRLVIDSTDGKAVLEEVKAAPQPLLYHYVLRASWERKEDRIEEALKLLLEGAALPGLTEREKIAADEFILSFALESDGNSGGITHAKVESLQKAAKEAAVRLGKVATETNDIQRVSGMMAALGMAAESKALAARANPVQKQMQQARSRLVSYYGSGNAQSQAAALLEKGRRDLALRIITRELKNMARSSSGRDMDDYYLRQWTQLVSRFGIGETLKASFQTSADEKNPEKLRRAAFVLTALGSQEDSLALWEKLYAANPGDTQAFQRVLQTALRADMPKAQKMIAGLTPEQFGVAGGLLARLVSAYDNNGSYTSTDQKQVATMIAEMLERLKPEDYGKAYVGWMQNAVTNFARTGRMGRSNSLPSLLVVPRPAEYNGQRGLAYEKEMDARQALFDRIVTAGLKIPGCAREAAALTAALRIARGAKEDEQVPMIREAMRIQARGPHGPYPPNMSSTSYGGSSGEVQIPDCEAFLARHAFATKNPGLLDEVDKELKDIAKEVADAAAKKENPSLLNTIGRVFGSRPSSPADNPDTLLARYRILYFGTEKEVIDRLKQMSWPGGDPLPEVFVAMERRRMEPGLIPLVEPRIANNNYDGRSAAAGLLRLLLKVKSPKEAAAWMEKLAEVTLGPEAKRNGTVGGGNSNAYYFLGNFSDRGDAAQQFFLTDQYWRHYGRFLSPTRTVTYGSEWKISGRDLFAKPDAKEALVTLKVSPFLADVAAFNALPRYKERTLFESCGETIGKFDAKVKDEIVKALEPDAKQFGTAMLLAYLKHEKPGAALLDVAAAHEEEFKKLPAEKGVEWAWLRQRITTDVKPDTLKEPLKSLLEWLEKFTEVKGEAKKPGTGGALDQFLAAKSFTDLGVQYHELDSYVPGTFGQMLAANPERAGELWKKLRALQGSLMKANASSSGSYGYYIENPVATLLRQRSTAWGSSPGPEVLVELRGMLDAWQAPEGFPLSYVILGEHITTALSAAGRQKGKDGKAGPVEIERVLKAMTDHLDEKQGILVTSLLETVLFNLKAHEKPEVRGQLEKLSASAPDSWAHRILADALAQRMSSWIPSDAREKAAKAAEAARAKAKKEGKSAEEIAALPDPAAIRRRPIHRGITDPDKLPEYQRKYAAFAGDRNVNANIRAGVLIHAALHHDGSAEPALFIAGLRTQAEMLRGGGLLDEGLLSKLLGQLTIWLSQPGVTAPADFKPLLRETVGAWRAALRRPNSRSYNSSGYAAAPLLDLAILLDDDETIAGILSAVPDQLSAHWLVRLLGAGKTEAAARIVLNGKDSLLADNYYGSYSESLADKSQWFLSAAVQEKLPAFIESLQSPAHRALAAALFANFPDAPGLPPRDERMTAAARLLPPPSTGAASDVYARTVAILSGNNAARAAIAPQIGEQVKELSLTMLPDARDQALAARQRKLLEAHLANCMAAGNIEPVKKQLTALANLETNNDYNAARLLGSVTGKLIGESNAALAKMSEEVRAANRAMWAELVLGPEWYGSYANSNYADLYSTAGRVFHAMVLYAHDDKMADFRALLAKQPEEVQTRLLEHWRNLDLNDNYKNLPSWPWPKKEDELVKERSRLTVRLIQTTLGFPGYHRGGATTWLRDRIKQKNLLKADLYAVEDIFRKQNDASRSERGIPATELAELHRLDGDMEKATDWLKVAESQLDDSGVIPYFDNLNARAIVLRRMDRKGEALAVLQSAKSELLQNKDFSGERRALYERTLNELDTEVLLASGADKATAALAERLTAAPDDAQVWTKFAVVTEMLGQQALKNKQWPEAADWHLLSSVTLTRLGAKDKDRADAARAGWNVEQASLAQLESGAAVTDFLTLVPRAAKWRYLDDGAVPPAGWHDDNFDDSKWPEGPAPLGYGDPGMGTETKPGGPDATNHAITTAFRHSFDLKDPAAVRNLELHYRVDDGCIVYLNGKEIKRHNMPEGSVDHETRATTAVSGSDETRWHVQKEVDPALLRAGRNFLAVEVHQDKPTSTDLAFDALLRANDRPLEEVYADYWKRPMSSAVGAFWQKLPESFRRVMQTAPK